MNSKQIPMGVINLTPNSFSDGGKYFDPSQLIATLRTYHQTSSNELTPFCLDFGAESTAPFNQAITAIEEWQRYEEYLLPLLENAEVLKLLEQAQFSIDSYHPQTIEKLLPLLAPVTKKRVIWNDISGVIDQQVISLLKKYSEIDYVFCHNLAPDRERSSSHMDYIYDGELAIEDHLKLFFEEGLEKLASHDIDLKRIILDPCFGFSKNSEHNWQLLKESDTYIHCHKRWVLGVSKKSFLQQLSCGHDKQQKREYSERFHLLVLANWMKKYSQYNIYYRIHDLSVFMDAKKAQKLI